MANITLYKGYEIRKPKGKRTYGIFDPYGRFLDYSYTKKDAYKRIDLGIYLLYRLKNLKW